MNTTSSSTMPNAKTQPVKRLSAKATDPEVLTTIYNPEINLSVWQRELDEALLTSVSDFLNENPNHQTALTLNLEEVASSMRSAFGDKPNHEALVTDITILVDMFCCLMDNDRVGLRITALHEAMCPSFHVDKVTCRLITTCHGDATQWLPNALADRRQLGPRPVGVSDEASGIYSKASDIEQLTCDDVGLLKGELWQDNEGGGVVHRSPAVVGSTPRLLLTLDSVV